MALVRACLSRNLPLIVVLGATGTGKTKLSLELALKYQTEVISADSMQIYKGLDLITAKATPHERSLVPHHILDILQPHQTYTVVDFRNKAVKIIDDLLAENKIPVVVGGTSYYIESILWKVLVEDVDLIEQSKLLSERDNEFIANKKQKTDKLPNEFSKEGPITFDGKNRAACGKAEISSVDSLENKDSNAHKGMKRKVDEDAEIDEDISDDSKLSNEELHARLKTIDPEMADRLHPNNRRKILRSLQIFFKTGKRHSSVLEEQRSQEGGSGLGGPLRYTSAIILWLHCNQEVLDRRLTDRVDSMIKDGLVQELTDFHEKYNRQRIVDGQQTDYTKGVFQSIGFKEFHDYLMLNEEERQTENGIKHFEQSLENLNIATKRYSRRQVKMIKNRFLGHPGRQVPPIYKLDTSDVSQWNINVTEKAFDIVESFINDKECSIKPEVFSTAPSYEGGLNPNTSHYCEVCRRVLVGDLQFNAHMKSNKHQKVLKKIKKASQKNSQIIKGSSSL